jgi:uncharacterized membrane protein
MQRATRLRTLVTLVLGAAGCLGGSSSRKAAAESPRAEGTSSPKAEVTACRATVTSCAQPPSWARVRPVLERSCLGCHGGDGIAAQDHDLSSPEAFRIRRRRVVDQVSACAMPPTGVTPLDAEEAATLLEFALCEK